MALKENFMACEFVVFGDGERVAMRDIKAGSFVSLVKDKTEIGMIIGAGYKFCSRFLNEYKDHFYFTIEIRGDRYDYFPDSLVLL